MPNDDPLVFTGGEFTITWSSPPIEREIPLPGCRECGIYALGPSAILCPHGVTPGIVVDVSISVTTEIISEEQYRAWLTWLSLPQDEPPGRGESVGQSGPEEGASQGDGDV